MYINEFIILLVAIWIIYLLVRVSRLAKRLNMKDKMLDRIVTALKQNSDLDGKHSDITSKRKIDKKLVVFILDWATSGLPMSEIVLSEERKWDEMVKKLKNEIQEESK